MQSLDFLYLSHVFERCTTVINQQILKHKNINFLHHMVWVKILVKEVVLP